MLLIERQTPAKNIETGSLTRTTTFYFEGRKEYPEVSLFISGIVSQCKTRDISLNSCIYLLNC